MTAMVLCVPLILASCGRRPPVARAAPPPAVIEESPSPPPPPPPAAPASEPEPASAAPPTLSEEEIFAGKTLEELNAERPLGDVFFDCDEFTIRNDARAVLQQNADWLSRWTSTRITIEGHCDARGTNEYNLALGDRRGHAVREYLVSLGVESQRIVVVSKGEESPICFDETEACWQRNRRAHPIITAK
jgi:peptidoglycan-associated lipoprotein